MKGILSMTAEEILRSLYSPEIKNVIFDGDFAAEIDDQYAFAYSLGSPKLRTLAVNASAYYEEPDAADTRTVMLRSFREIERVYASVPEKFRVPAFEGASSQITANPGFAPSDCPAVRNIIETAKRLTEPLYLLTTGPCTHAVSAVLTAPEIADRLCVIWVGGRCIEPAGKNKKFHEWNLFSDYAAAQLLFNLDIPLVFLPCDPIGTVNIAMGHADLAKLEGTSETAVFFREKLPLLCEKPEKFASADWRKIMCDFAAPAALSVPDAIEFSIIPAPVLEDDHRYSVDPARRKIVCGVNPDSGKIVADAMEAIRRLC